MLARGEYLELLENALEQYKRYRAMYTREADVAFVVSPGVVAAIRAYEAGNPESLYDSTPDPIRMRRMLRLRGVDVYQVIQRDGEDIFSPAFVLNNDVIEAHFNGTFLDGDRLISSDFLYVYSAERHGFINTGYTVENGVAMECWPQDGINAEGIGTGIFFDAASPGALLTPASVQEALFDLMRSREDSYHHQRRKVKAEQELNPGDTKAIDDYLNSFARQGMLREA